MAISRAQLLKELLPGLNALFGLEYATYGEQHKEIYELFTERECECYIGAVDELKDARPLAIDWIAEREST